MKKLFFSFVLYAIFIASVQAQTPTAIVTGPGTSYVYVGSLVTGANDSGNSQKIAIKIIGGSWFSDTNGETNFYISNRGGLVVNQASMGSSYDNKLSLKAYQNGSNIDFYLIPKSDDYTSFAVTSFTYGAAMTSQFITIASQTTTPSGTDITSSIVVSPIMVTDSHGNVGIGTTDSRGYKLAVNGKVRAQEIKVEASPWPDYVFAKDYQLPTLQETEKHIKDKGHLPGIPSATEVKANGVDVGAMNAKLLQKIEELTLHLIEMKKENDRQKQKNRSLEERLNKIESH